MRRRRLVLAVLAAVVAPVLAVAGSVIVVHLEHPRDEAAFLEYLRLYGRYDASVAGHSLAWTGPPDDGSVAAAAWAHLCPATLELHKPHFAFTSSQPD